MNRALKRVSIAVLVMFVALLINVNYLQAFEAPSLASGLGNVRTLDEQAQVQRGPIVTSDGKTVAESKSASDGGYQREYPGGAAFAPVTGFDGVNGSGGMEQAEDSLLSGTGSQLAFRNFIDLITNKPEEGATVELTINSKAQEAAYKGLEGILQGTNRVGGVVALNPSTGAILAMASYPSYNPNQLATADGTQFNNLDEQLIKESPSPLTNNATQTTLPPGSTFKLITSSAYFTQNTTSTTSTPVYSPAVLTLPQSNQLLHNDADESCGSAGASGSVPIIDAFALSCDTTFANIGMELGGTTLNNMAEKYGFNSAPSITGVTTVPSNYTVSASQALTAYTAIGQYDDTATSLQEAMDAAAIANNGVLMKPYLVQQVTASDLSVVHATQPAELSQSVSPSVANDVKQMMIAVVQQPDGTGYAFNQNVEGVEIAGKTGTAQTMVGSNVDDAAFVAFAPASDPKIAVGVMVQGAGYGATAAAPIAVNVIKAYLASVG